MSRHCRSSAVLLALWTAACGDTPTDTQADGSDETGAAASSGGGPGETGAATEPDDPTGGASQSGTTQGPEASTSTTADPTAETSDSGDPTGPPVEARCGDEPPPGAILAPEIPAYDGMCPLIITGYAENAAIGNGHLDPGMAILTKPFAMSTLGNKVRGMLEG